MTRTCGPFWSSPAKMHVLSSSRPRCGCGYCGRQWGVEGRPGRKQRRHPVKATERPPGPDALFFFFLTSCHPNAICQWFVGFHPRRSFKPWIYCSDYINAFSDLQIILTLTSYKHGFLIQTSTGLITLHPHDSQMTHTSKAWPQFPHSSSNIFPRLINLSK